MSFSVWDYVNPLDVEVLGQRFQSEKPTRLVCIEEFLKPEFARAVAESYPSYVKAQDQGHEFKWVNERVKVQITDSEVMPVEVATLHRILADPEFLGTVQEITGIGPLVADPSLAGAGMHIMGPGGRLGVHTDFTRLKSGLHRRLNILVYLNQDWKEEWDGGLEVWDPPVKNRLHRFMPEFNRCILFNTTTESFHGVNAVRAPAGISRNSFAAYYYTEQAPENWDGEGRSTVYKARPDEWFKGYVQMPVETMRKRIEKPIRKAYYKLRGIEWGAASRNQD